ncbi:DUF4368 domain-containing protein [Listeria innocua]|uniref:DUF4368 domain-containing protein n=1 Tax=Listeria innocua TaxID=1642 RepID=UPI001494BE33|nr:DUF4368 domain-containing protein [Listeria innocua]EIB7772914.1 DUF4368 domain-containing protein [Listeria innocua]EIX7077267.1 DUF4368 domain-containing protein [Listeria innocua]EIX7080190.1 DUF4368 domain-containing protein [Listeria innocua]EIX7081895.1 DUF4368 domain-containing protein [Listeria innocua]
MVHKHVNFDSLTPELLHEMIDKIIVHTGKKIEVHYKFGLGELGNLVDEHIIKK